MREGLITILLFTKQHLLNLRTEFVSKFEKKKSIAPSHRFSKRVHNCKSDNYYAKEWVKNLCQAKINTLYIYYGEGNE